METLHLHLQMQTATTPQAKKSATSHGKLYVRNHKKRSEEE